MKRRGKPRLIPDARLPEVRALYAEGLSDREVGARLGCAGDTARDFRRRHRIPLAPRTAGRPLDSKPWRPPRQLAAELRWDFSGENVPNPRY